eukprot:3127304-Lingulodinium_polyedra.AAC.1
MGHTEEALKALHIAIESLRNGYDLLLPHLKGFVSESIQFEATAFDQSEVFGFWVAVGVEPDVAEFLANHNIRWSGGKLLAHESARNLP